MKRHSWNVIPTQFMAPLVTAVLLTVASHAQANVILTFTTTSGPTANGTLYLSSLTVQQTPLPGSYIEIGNEYFDLASPGSMLWMGGSNQQTLSGTASGSDYDIIVVDPSYPLASDPNQEIYFAGPNSTGSYIYGDWNLSTAGVPDDGNTALMMCFSLMAVGVGAWRLKPAVC